MSQVYSNGATIDLCAISSRNSLQVLFCKGMAPAMSPVTVRLSSCRNSDKSNRALCDSRLWVNAVDLALLTRRGWSLRASSFQAEHMFWL
jgi:hypothetical protein